MEASEDDINWGCVGGGAWVGVQILIMRSCLNIFKVYSFIVPTDPPHTHTHTLLTPMVY